MTLCGAPGETRNLRIVPIRLARARTVKIPPNTAIKVTFSGMAGSVGGWGKREECVADALQEDFLLSSGLHLDRRPKTQRAKQRNRNQCSLGHYPAKVLDPHRDQLDIRVCLGQIVDSGFERKQIVTQVACAFRKDDQRIAGLLALRPSVRTGWLFSAPCVQ